MPDRSVRHAVCSIDDLLIGSAQVIAGPVKLSFESFRLAALMEQASTVSANFHFDTRLRMTWSLLIADHIEKTPLFSTTSGGRALLLVGEIIKCLFEGFRSFDHHLLNVAPNLRTNRLELSFSIGEGDSALRIIGSGLCLASMIDALLFVRGLHIMSAEIAVDAPAEEHQDFINLYRAVVGHELAR